MGDFNLLYRHWTSRQSRALGSELIDLMNANSLQQHVSQPIRKNVIFQIVITAFDLRIIGLKVTDNYRINQQICRLQECHKTHTEIDNKYPIRPQPYTTMDRNLANDLLHR
ncbi:hypothetical protein FHG87_006236 [Trinorchestia longiramus]|nr:hypothetical protein FHG87_006236 [Trinorchestia longiramus]